MSKLKLIITDKAKEDISIITDYIGEDNKVAAKIMSEYLYKICGDLALFPDMGISRPDFTYKDFKFFIIKKHYIIAYRVIGNNLYIARVLTGYQDICSLF